MDEFPTGGLMRAHLKDWLVDRGIDGHLPRWLVRLAIFLLGLKRA